MRDALQAVVIGVLRQSAIVEGPCQPVDCILLVLDGLHHDLRIHVVCHSLVKVAFHWQRLIDELLVVLLLGVLGQQAAHAGLINAWPACTTHHLQHVVDRIIHIAVLSAIKLLGVHDDDQVRQHGHTPAQLLRGNEHLDGPSLEKPLNDGALGVAEALVQEANTVLKRLLQRLLTGSRKVRFHGFVRDVQESLGLVVRCGMQQQVDGCHAGLLSVGHEHDHRLVWGVVLDGLVDWPAHGKKPGRAMVDVEALDDHLQRDSPHVRREVEETCAAGADPLADVLGVGQGGSQGHDTDGLLHLNRDVAHPAHHSLQGWPDVAVQQVELVHDEEADLLHALARLPAAAHQVPLLRGGDDQVRFLEDLDIAGRLSNELGNLEAHHLAELVRPLVEALLGCGRMWRDVDAALHRVIPGEHPDNGKLSANDLSTGCRSTDQAVVVGRVKRAERLGLNGVEDLQTLGCVELLCIGAAQGRERQRLQIKQLGVRWVLLRQDEVAEGHWQECLRIDPSVGDHADEVLRGKRLSDGHREVQGVLLLRSSLLQHKHLLMQDLLAVHILDEDPEGLRAAMNAGIPLEVGSDGELHHEAGASDRLHVGTQIKLGKLVNKLVDGLAHFWEADQLANLCAGQIVVALPSKILLLDLAQDVLSQALEVAQRGLRAPHPLVNHLAPVQGPQGKGGPTSTKTDLENGAHDSASGLLNIHHVGEKRVALQLELGDVGLKEHVHLRRCLLSATFHGNWHALHELCQLDLLLLADGDVFELVGQREETEKLDVGHHRPQVVVVGGNRRILDVVVAGDSPQSGDLHLSGTLVILDEVVLVQEHEGTVNQVDTTLFQKLVFLSLIRRDAVKTRVAHHTHVEVRVPKPVDSILTRLDGSQHELCVDHVWKAAQQLGLNRQLLIEQ
mmetsp:Transcript_57678/g.103594  ORF Transcript_57678/g.103594 Transcript_57678/m.103594 type:complete len:900 (+) Transcript_57678:1228-3927(+)